MARATPKSWQDRLAAAVRAQPKKAAALAALTLAMGGLWVKMIATDGPAAARAVAPPAAMQAAGGMDVTAVPVVPSGAADAATKLREWVDGDVTPLGRNLFAVKLDYFPQEPGKVVPPPPAPAGEGFWERVEKSMAARADLERRRGELIEGLRKQAARLEVQGRMISQGKPKALINGKLVGEGEDVAEFRLVKIEAGRIIVEREGVRLQVLTR